MDNYIVSARKYRPQTFDSVVGQHTLTTTLKNAIATKRLAHAYLFCGPRGVGKTTCARIFAKAINCLSPDTDGEACNQCESCKAFNEGRSFNIFELDAASNNSVEDIRQIIEQVNIPPQVGMFKVFIIDEVHMLSQSAFNAFLKTLEEPPKYVIFILATTEKHKVLPTILSRCQIYDFNRMSIEDTINHLQYVAQKEGIEVDENALSVIAQKADGGMRDALSIFDQISNFSEGHITYELTIANLNVLDYEYYFKITDEILNIHIPEVLLILNNILSKGFDGAHFMVGLASHFRNLLIAQEPTTIALLETSQSIKQRYIDQAKKCKPSFLYKALRLCSDCDVNYKISRNKRLLVELTLIEISQLGDEDDSSNGRSPRQQLSPIFNKKNVEIKDVQQDLKSIPQAETKLPLSTSKNKPIGSLEVKVEKPIAKIKRTVSIHNVSLKEKESPQMTNDYSSVNKQNNEINNNPFSETDLQCAWMSYAQRLPIEESAMKGRMANLVPKLVRDTIVDVPVETEMVLNDYKRLKHHIEAFLQKELSNSNIVLSIRILEHTEENRVYGKREQYQMLLKNNKAFSFLCNELNLVLE